jgi:hypothetical protein
MNPLNGTAIETRRHAPVNGTFRLIPNAELAVIPDAGHFRCFPNKRG